MPERPERPVANASAPEGGAGRDPDSTPDAERRVNTRFPITVTAEVVEPKSKARVTGRTSDVGIGGCYVDTLNPYPVGTAVNLRLAQDNRSFQTRAVVVYAHSGMGMGLAFTELAHDQMEVLQVWIRELVGGTTPSPERPVAPDVGAPPIHNERQVLNQLISLLIRKGTLTEAEGAALQRQLFH